MVNNWMVDVVVEAMCTKAIGVVLFDEIE